MLAFALLIVGYLHGPDAKQFFALANDLNAKDAKTRLTALITCRDLGVVAAPLLGPITDNVFHRNAAIATEAALTLKAVNPGVWNSVLTIRNNPDPQKNYDAILELHRCEPAVRVACRLLLVDRTPAAKSPDKARWLELPTPGHMDLRYLEDSSPTHVEYARALFRSPIPSARKEAVLSLGDTARLNPAIRPVHVKLLTAALLDEKPAVRSSAARALGVLGRDASRSLPTLKKLLMDQEDYVRKAAADAIEKIDQE